MAGAAGGDHSGSHPSRMARLVAGPRLQFLNLLVFVTVVTLSLDYPHPWWWLAMGVAAAVAFDAPASRWRYGEWRMPWATMVGALGAGLLLDARGPLVFVAVAAIMVASKHLIRWRGAHLFNPNNVAASVLILAGVARVGVNDWGGAPQSVALMLLFGTIATVRAKRFDLAVAYLSFSAIAYGVATWAMGWGLASAWTYAFSPLQILIGFFAITDPATSPARLPEKLVWAALLVLLAVPATLAGRPEAPIFALLFGAPQRHLVGFVLRGQWPTQRGGPAPGPAGEPA